MLGVLLSVILAGFGTILSDAVVSDEFYRTVNTFLNLLTVIAGPWVVYKIGQKALNKTLEPKVDKVVENTKHLEEWDGTERRVDE